MEAAGLDAAAALRSWTGDSVGGCRTALRGEVFITRAVRSRLVRGGAVCLREDAETRGGEPLAAMAFLGEGGPWPRWGRASPPNGARLFACTRLDPSQWKSVRTTDATLRLNEEARRRIKAQTVLPRAGTVPMPLWALLASGQIRMRKLDGWETRSPPIEPMRPDRAA